jgi:elongation factor Tu
MPVESVLTISGRGTVVTGAVEQGTLALGDTVEVIGDDEPLATVVTGLETFGKSLDHVEAGDNAAVLLRGVRRHQARRGMVLVLPGSLRPWRRFRADLHVLTAAEGGRRTGFGTGYRPQFHIRTADAVGRVDLGSVARARPGDDVAVSVELGTPLALDVGLGFAIREGGTTVAAGRVTELLD